MSDLALWSGVVGFFLPLGVSVIQQPKWHDGAKAVVTFLLCLIAAAGTAYFEGKLTGQRFATSTLVVFVAAISSYKGLWKPTGTAPKIEAATSTQ